MKYITFTLFAIAALTWSCQKEVDGNIDGADGSNKFIKRAVQTDSDNPGQAVVLEFTYDNQNRVTRFDELYLDTVNGVAQVTDGQHYYFHYNGNDQLPTHADIGDDNDWTWYFKYDAQGKKIADSIVYINFGVHEVSSYTYSNNQLFASLDENVAFGITSERDTVTHDGNNISKYITYTANNGSTSFWSSTTYSYDNNPNPIHNLNIANAVFTSVYRQLSTYYGLNKNNPTVETESYLSPVHPAITTTTAYTYDSDKYPVFGATSYSFDPLFKTYIRYDYK